MCGMYECMYVCMYVCACVNGRERKRKCGDEKFLERKLEKQL
jgi:hypothetical protein